MLLLPRSRPLVGSSLRVTVLRRRRPHSASLLRRVAQATERVVCRSASHATSAHHTRHPHAGRLLVARLLLGRLHVRLRMVLSGSRLEGCARRQEGKRVWRLHDQ